MDSRTGILGLLCFATGLSAAGAPAGEQADDKALLERMAEAVRVLDYQGTFVYLQNNQLEALQIEHRSGENGTQERLFSLNGSPREVVRDGATVTCILPDRDSVLVDQPVAQGSFPDLLGIGLDELAANYRFEWLGRDRVAGRSAQVVAIVPRDNLRYGYRLYLDRDSGLPLKSDLMDEAGNPVEQSMFTSLQVDPDSLERLVGLYEPPPGTRPREAVASQHRWVFSTLPKGFNLDLHELKPSSRDADQVEHFLLSDGLASLSVFVERGGADEALQGGARMGAVSAWGGLVAGHQVTVVGDVPLDTVRQVLQGLRPKGDQP